MKKSYVLIALAILVSAGQVSASERFGTATDDRSAMTNTQSPALLTQSLSKRLSFAITFDGSSVTSTSSRPHRMQKTKAKRMQGLPIAGGHAGITFRGALGIRFGVKF